MRLHHAWHLAILTVCAIMPARADVSVPFARFQEMYRSPEVIREPAWGEVMTQPEAYHGRIIGLQVEVKGRIDDGTNTELYALTKDDRTVRIQCAGGCNAAGLGLWIAVLARVAEAGPASGLVAIAATRIAAPQRPTTSSAPITGGANGASGIGSAGRPAFADPPQAEPVQESIPDGVAPESVDGLQQRQNATPETPQNYQTQPTPANGDAAVAIIEGYIYSRNKRVGAAERRLIAQEIVRWSNYHGMRWEFFTAVVAAESDFNRRCVSTAGAMGLGQLMPFNCTEYGVSDPYDIRQNLRGSAQHLREFLDRYRERDPWTQLSLTLACYNAGPGAVKKYGGVPPYNETRTYIQRVAKYYMQLVQQSSAVG